VTILRTPRRTKGAVSQGQQLRGGLWLHHHVVDLDEDLRQRGPRVAHQIARRLRYLLRLRNTSLMRDTWYAMCWIC